MTATPNEFEVKTDKGKVKFAYVIGTSLEELVEQFGAEAVASRARAGIVQALRNAVATHTNSKAKGKPSLEKFLAGWKLGAGRRKSAAEKLADAVAKFTPEELAEFNRLRDNLPTEDVNVEAAD